MKSTMIFQTVLIALDAGAAIMCAIGGDLKRAVYWFAAATITATVTY